MPALSAVHPAAQANVLALAGMLREEAAVLDELVGSVLGGRDEIELATLRELAPALRRLVVQRLADSAAGAPAAGVARRAEEVAAMSARGTGEARSAPAGDARHGRVTAPCGGRRVAGGRRLAETPLKPAAPPVKRGSTMVGPSPARGPPLRSQQRAQRAPRIDARERQRSDRGDPRAEEDLIPGCASWGARCRGTTPARTCC